MGSGIQGWLDTRLTTARSNYAKQCEPRVCLGWFLHCLDREMHEHIVNGCVGGDGRFCQRISNKLIYICLDQITNTTQSLVTWR